MAAASGTPRPSQGPLTRVASAATGGGALSHHEPGHPVAIYAVAGVAGELVEPVSVVGDLQPAAERRGPQAHRPLRGGRALGHEQRGPDATAGRVAAPIGVLVQGPPGADGDQDPAEPGAPCYLDHD